MSGATEPPPGQQEKPSWDSHVKRISGQLHEIYITKIKPLEDRFKYDMFRPSWFEETIVNQKPFVTFFGPWSAGKSTFINHLLQSNYLWTGPQPTTAEFTVIVHAEDSGPIDGRILANAKDMPFRGLNEFGEQFLQNFQGFGAPHELLKNVTLIDTPGVLESAKDIHQRKYDYIRLARWFAERSDLIFVMFDPSKLDAGVELRLLFRQSFKGMESKVRIVLNKADSVNTQELMRVYGSLFWNLSNMISSTEPPRVYCGSFWDQPYKEGTFHLLFSEEKTDLIHELTETVPMQALDKKIASLIRRAKDVFVHAIIIGGMRQDLPTFFGKDKAKKKALDELNVTYERVGAKYKMNWRDFPPVDEYRAFLDKFDLETFPTLEKVDKEGLLVQLLQTIDHTLPKLIRPVKSSAMNDPRNKETRQQLQQGYHATIENQVRGVQGIQGSSDTVATGLRDVNFQQIAAQQAAAQQQQQPGGYVQNNFATPPPPTQPAPTAAPNPMMAMMMQNPQMMQMMMQNPQMMQQFMAMNQQPQQPQGAAAYPTLPAAQQAPPPPPPPPPPPKEAAPLPPASHADPNAQMMAMMAQMQQQNQQAQAAPQPTTPAPQAAAVAQPAPAQMSQEQMMAMMAQMQQQKQQPAAASTAAAPSAPQPQASPVASEPATAPAPTAAEQPAAQPAQPGQMSQEQMMAMMMQMQHQQMNQSQPLPSASSSTEHQDVEPIERPE